MYLLPPLVNEVANPCTFGHMSEWPKPINTEANNGLCLIEMYKSPAANNSIWMTLLRCCENYDKFRVYNKVANN